MVYGRDDSDVGMWEVVTVMYMWGGVRAMCGMWGGVSLVPRPSPAPVFDRFQYAKTEPEGLVNLTT